MPSLHLGRRIEFFYLARYHEDHSLTDIGGAVSYPFQVMGHPDEIGSPSDGPRVVHHEDQQFPVYLIVEGVHLVIFLG